MVQFCEKNAGHVELNWSGGGQKYYKFADYEMLIPRRQNLVKNDR